MKAEKPLLERPLLILLAGWLLFALASIWLRPLWPVDETRYASVAWEMWLRGDFLVPYVNGEPYSHKPPLLFWLIHAGWALFGVSEWWPRMIAPLAALAAVPLLFKMEDLLWGKRGDAAWILFGTLLFAAFTTLLMFDLLLLDCALAGMIGVLELSKENRKAGLLWLGAGIGLGVLVKGPVILLHVLPAAVVAPWWTKQLKGKLGRWYLDLFLGVLVGAAIALAWALPAAYFGGEQYRHAILWGQTAGRVAESFAHRAPFWYYLPYLPLILFPWLLWPRLWPAFRGMLQDPGEKFLLAWLVLTVAGFSLVSGKQAKYLVPMLPAFALLAGHALARASSPARGWDLLPPALGFAGAAAFVGVLRADPAKYALPEWVAGMPAWPIVLLALIAPGVMVFCKKPIQTQSRVLAFAMLAAFAVGGAGVIPAFVPYGDPGPAAQVLAGLQERKVPLAHLGKYHATYNFAGRLREPIEILDHHELRAWIEAHPQGRVITVERARSGPGPQPEYEAPFRGAWVQIWRGPEVLQVRSDLR